MQPEDRAQPLDVYTVLTVMIDQMSAIAWQKMGLQPDTVTGQIHKDLAQAKVAVDVVDQLAQSLSPQLDESDRRELSKLVANLKINYVQHASGES